MPDIIRDGQVVTDDWQLLDDEQALPDSGKVVVSLSRWQENRDALLQRGDVGVVLQPGESAGALAADCGTLPLIAVNFPVFTDGRGFSYGRELRERHGFSGELRAVGQFIRDQLHYLRRCGFNAFALENTDIEAALNSLNPFSDSYQAAVDQPQPLFRRRH